MTRTFVDTGDGTDIATWAIEVSNPLGRWLGASTGGFESDQTLVLSGVDDYEGLTAYVTVSATDGVVEGVVFPSDMPSVSMESQNESPAE